MYNFVNAYPLSSFSETITLFLQALVMLLLVCYYEGLVREKRRKKKYACHWHTHMHKIHHSHARTLARSHARTQASTHACTHTQMPSTKYD
jgi:hypothetical protein